MRQLRRHDIRNEVLESNHPSSNSNQFLTGPGNTSSPLKKRAPLTEEPVIQLSEKTKSNVSLVVAQHALYMNVDEHDYWEYHRNGYHKNILIAEANQVLDDVKERATMRRHEERQGPFLVTALNSVIIGTRFIVSTWASLTSSKPAALALSKKETGEDIFPSDIARDQALPAPENDRSRKLRSVDPSPTSRRTFGADAQKSGVIERLVTVLEAMNVGFLCATEPSNDEDDEIVC